MIVVKFYGLLRLNSGIKELQIEAVSLKDLFYQLEHQGFSQNELSSCNVLVNGSLASKRVSLKDGDTVQFFPPVAGG